MKGHDDYMGALEHMRIGPTLADYEERIRQSESRIGQRQPRVPKEVAPRQYSFLFEGTEKEINENTGLAKLVTSLQAVDASVRGMISNSCFAENLLGDSRIRRALTWHLPLN